MSIRTGRQRRWVATALAVMLLASPATGLAAGTKQPTREELEERIRRLERIIDENGLDKPAAERKRTTIGEPPTLTPEEQQQQVESIVDEKLKKQKVLAGWKDGFFLESPSGDFKLKVRGLVQTDVRYFPNSGGDTGVDSIYMRRVRPIFEGTAYKYFDFKIMPDFGDGKTVLQDAYADITYFPYAKFRAGKFKVPFSLERLQSASDLLFVERSIANNLPPNRDEGLQLFGDLFDGVLSYQAGFFNGVIDGGSTDLDTTGSKQGAVRLWSQPFRLTNYRALQNLGVGVASTYGDQKDEGETLSALAYKTPGRTTFFKYTSSSTVSVQQRGQQFRFQPQAYWYWGPFGILGEYTIENEGVQQKNSSTGSNVQTSLQNNAWFVQSSWVLTGEDASYKGVSPINPFDPLNGRWGAFEIAARGSVLQVDEKAFTLGLAAPGTSTIGASEWGVGLNWYLNRNYRIMLDFEHTGFDQNITIGGKSLNHESVLLTRFQISY